MDSTTKKLNVENERKGGIGVDFSTCGCGWTCSFLEWGHLGVLLCHAEHKAPFRCLGGEGREMRQ